MEQTAKQPPFPLGQIVTTPGTLASLRKAGQGPPEFLGRHVSGGDGLLQPCKRSSGGNIQRTLPRLRKP
jgi:hypothetical protein